MREEIRRIVENVVDTKFWLDIWAEESSVNECYWRLYRLSSQRGLK